MTTFGNQFKKQAARSREDLIAYLSDSEIKVTNDVWRLIAHALVDARLDGMACGVTMMENRAQLETYMQGYTDAITDLADRGAL